MKIVRYSYDSIGHKDIYLWSLGYEARPTRRLRELQFLSLADRRTQYDLIQIFKVIKGIEDVNVNIWFKLVGENPARLTRNTSHSLNICANNPRCKLEKKNSAIGLSKTGMLYQMKLKTLLACLASKEVL